MPRHPSPLLFLGLGLVVAACDSIGGVGSGGTPIGIVLMNARTNGSGGYTTYPKINFYSVGSATFEFATLVSDTCVVAPFTTDTGATPNAQQIGAGNFLTMTLSGVTDSLYKAVTGDQTYHPATLSGVAFNPGDTVTFQIAGDAAGFPRLTNGYSKTAEPFTIAQPTVPPAGQPMTVSWTPGSDPNAAMFVSLIYNTPANGAGLNTQIFCDFHDIDPLTGSSVGTVQAYLMPALESSNVGFVVHGQRVRTNLLTADFLLGYLNIISTFEVPTPASP
jgi:hypothetical protein